MKPKYAVTDAAENVDANGKCVDVVHADMIGKEIGKHHAAKDERHDRDTNTGRGSKEPDEEDEHRNAQSE